MSNFLEIGCVSRISDDFNSLTKAAGRLCGANSMVAVRLRNTVSLGFMGLFICIEVGIRSFPRGYTCKTIIFPDARGLGGPVYSG